MKAVHAAIAHGAALWKCAPFANSQIRQDMREWGEWTYKELPTNSCGGKTVPLSSEVVLQQRSKLVHLRF